MSLNPVAPRILYLCPKGKFSMDPWVDGKVWMSLNKKNIARKCVQERVEISFPGHIGWFPGPFLMEILIF